MGFDIKFDLESTSSSKWSNAVPLTPYTVCLAEICRNVLKNLENDQGTLIQTSWLEFLSEVLLFRKSLLQPTFAELQKQMLENWNEKQLPKEIQKKILDSIQLNILKIKTASQIEDIFEDIGSLLKPNKRNGRQVSRNSLIGFAIRSLIISFEFMSFSQMDHLVDDFLGYINNSSKNLYNSPMLLADMKEIFEEKDIRFQELKQHTENLLPHVPFDSPFKCLKQPLFQIQLEEGVDNRDLPLVYSANLQGHENITEQQEDQKVSPNTVFQLSRVCHKFGHRKMALQVISEAVRTGQNEQDVLCLQKSALLFVQLLETGSANYPLQKCLETKCNNEEAINPAVKIMTLMLLIKYLIMNPSDKNVDKTKLWKSLYECHLLCSGEEGEPYQSKLLLLHSIIWKYFGMQHLTELNLKFFLKHHSDSSTPDDIALGLCGIFECLPNLEKEIQAIGERLCPDSLENTFKEGFLLAKVNRALNVGNVQKLDQLWKLPELLISPQQNLELYDQMLFCDAKLLFAKDQILEAFVVGHEVLKICKRSGKELLLAKHLLFLAKIHQKLGNHVDSIPYILQSISISERFELGDVQLEGFITLVETFIETDLFDKARRTLERSMHQILSYGTPLQRIKAHLALAKCLLAKFRNNENLMIAEGELHTARRICITCKQTFCVKEQLKFIFYSLARIYHQLERFNHRDIASEKFCLLVESENESMDTD